MRTRSEFDLPPWAFDPVRQAATRALNASGGKPIVDVRCPVPWRNTSCGRPLGAARRSPFGVVVALNRLRGGRDSIPAYQWMAAHPVDRMRAWEEGGSILLEPVLLLRHGEWYRVPGADDQPTVRCPRHRPSLLDVDGLMHRIEEALSTDRMLTFGAHPPNAEQRTSAVRDH